MPESLSEKIAQAWRLRVNLRTEECLSLIADLKHELGLPSGELSASWLEDALSGTQPIEAIANVIVLCSYMLRQIGESAAGESYLAALDTALKRRGISLFELSYEKAMVDFLRGDFGLALEHFLHAALAAKSPLHRLWGKVNALFCMENLGIPYGKTREEVERLAAIAGEREDVERVKRQLFSLDLREGFRRGEIAKALAREAARPSCGLDQGRYYALWLTALPYHRGHRKPDPAELPAFLEPAPLLHHRAYRLRTLQGIVHPQDAEILKPSEWVDRLYLWTWRWLLDPQSLSIQKITPLVAAAAKPGVSHRLTWEDYQLTRNALLWLGLFDPRGAREAAGLLGALRNHHGEDFSLLQLEFLVISYLEAVRDGRESQATDYREALVQHPLWGSRELGFRAMIEPLDSGKTPTGPLAALSRRLRALLIPEKGARLYIDMGAFSVYDAQSGRRILSQPLAAALQLLESRPVVSVEEFLSATFQIRNYDPTCHDAKIFNLLARLRAITGNAPRFRVKEGQVIAEGSWKGIRFAPELGPGLSGVFPAPARFPAAGEAERRPRRLEMFRELDWGAGLTRGEMERRLALPRSTSNRLLARWVSEGKIIRLGQSRQTVYRLSPLEKGKRRQEERS